MSDETITQVEGVKTTLPADAVADLVPKTETPEPAKTEEVKQPEKAPEAEAPKAVEPPTEPKEQKPDEQPRDSEGKFKPKKAGPIAALLEKKHELETVLSDKDKTIQDLQSKLDAAAEKPASPQATQDLKALAEKYNADPDLVAEIVAAARAGIKPVEIPKEIYDVIQTHKVQQEQQAELQAFESRVGKLASTFKDEPIASHKDKLLELAYSTEKAPDGEPYYQKELAELYFGFIKPQVEPGRKTAEPSKGGTTKTDVVDYAELMNDPAAIEKMSDDEFSRFSKWMQEHQKGSPIRRANS